MNNISAISSPPIIKEEDEESDGEGCTGSDNTGDEEAGENIIKRGSEQNSGSTEPGKEEEKDRVVNKGG
jgi:hypothetical protein